MFNIRELLKRWGGCKELQIQSELDSIKKILAELKKRFDDDTAYYDAQIKKLSELLMNTTKFVDLSKYLGKGYLLDPRGYFAGYRNSFADVTYRVMPKEDWIDILEKVNNIIDRTWTVEIFDCDNIALMMATMLQYSVFKSGFKEQLSFGIAWSPTHAYNVFQDSKGFIWVYEPQNNTIKGYLGQTEAPYDTIEIFYIG
jgi:hypothetical protein